MRLITIYDLEFEQPNKSKYGIKDANKPDMFAIKYNENGKMESICLVEVKSTESAITGNCGVDKHLKGMISYVKNTDLMEKRREEAHNIMVQYKDLKLRGLDSYSIPSMEDYKKLPIEIIFVFSHGYNLDSKIDKGQTSQTIRSIINSVIEEENKNDPRIEVGDPIDYSSNIVSGKESQRISAYRLTVKSK